jgi:hypothetical protein
VRIAKMAPPSLLQTERSLLQVAGQIFSDPHLFDFAANFDPGFLAGTPSNAGLSVGASFAVPCDRTQYIAVGLSLNHSDWRTKTDYMAAVGVRPFVLPNSCYGNPPAEDWFQKPPPALAEAESKHPPVQGWTLDLPQLWTIAKKHAALFANGVERCRITTVTRLRDADRPQCGQFTVFNWDASESPAVPSGQERLLNMEGQRTIIELVEDGLDIPRPGSTSGNRDCRQGHYLIVDAHSGADIESGTYLFCISPIA